MILSLSELGITSVHSNFDTETFSYDRYRATQKGNWKEAKLAGTGQIYDLGTHIIDQVVSLFGKPDKVTGFLENVRGLGHPEVDDNVRLFSVILGEFLLITPS